MREGNSISQIPIRFCTDLRRCRCNGTVSSCPGGGDRHSVSACSEGRGEYVVQREKQGGIQDGNAEGSGILFRTRERRLCGQPEPVFHVPEGRNPAGESCSGISSSMLLRILKAKHRCKKENRPAEAEGSVSFERVYGSRDGQPVL